MVFPTISNTIEARAAHTPANSSDQSRYPGSFSTVSILYMYLNRKNAGSTAASTYIKRILIGLKNIMHTSFLFFRYLLCNYFNTAHVLSENFRDYDTAVSLLIVFQHCCSSTSDGQTRTV